MLPSTGTCCAYHGTSLFAARVIQHYGVWLGVQRTLTDFGQGFYVTFQLEQAKKWASVRAAHPQVNRKVLDYLKISSSQYFSNPDTWVPAYIVYNLNTNTLFQSKGMVFPLPGNPEWPNHEDSWKTFVKNSRQDVKHPFDFVYGPVGARHDQNPAEVTASPNKDQLSFHSEKAIGCLSGPRIITFKESKKTAMTILRGKKVRAVPSGSFLPEIRDELVKAGGISAEQADRMLKKSWVAKHAAEPDSILAHEAASYWAFTVLHGTNKLWHQEYEDYVLDRCGNKSNRSSQSQPSMQR